MVGGCEEGNFLGIRIWEFERIKMVWVEIECMFCKLWCEFVEMFCFFCYFFGFGNGNIICLIILESFFVVVFDLEDCIWKWLFGCFCFFDINNW